MPTQQQTIDELIAYVTRYMVCEGCHTAYAPDSVQVVLHRDAQWGLIATCPACRAERAVTAFDQPPYMRLRPDDTVIPARITKQTVAEWASFLSEFTGDIYDLLAPSE